MAQQQHAVDVHPDELCPPKKRYDLMDANKKVDLEHVECPPKSKILTNIIKNHSLRFSIAASSSIPWIHMAQFWNTLKEDESKYRLRFMLDKKELTLTLDDFIRSMDLYGTVLAYFEGRRIKVSAQDQPPLQIMKMMYCFINNIHVDYAELLWEGIHYSLYHPTSLIPYPRFTKIIISHYMTNFPEISRRARDMYQNLKYDDIMKNIFNSGRYKDKVFGIGVPLTQSQPTESTQGTHRTPSSPRSPNPNMDAGVSSAPKRLTMIHFRIPQRRSIRLTPPAPVPIVDKANEMILQDTLQVSHAEHKSREEQEARENVELVNEHLAFVEIEKMVEGPENVIDDSSIPRNDDQNIYGTRLEPRSDKESPEVEITNDEERREKGKIIEESRSTPFPTLIRPPRIHTDLVSSDTEKL
ncbi:hypothetical protein Tco_1065094 [Tanacetum coccineum]